MIACLTQNRLPIVINESGNPADEGVGISFDEAVELRNSLTEAINIAIRTSQFELKLKGQYPAADRGAFWE